MLDSKSPERCEALIAELTRRTLFLEALKQAEADGKISKASSYAIWQAYHTVYSMCDLHVLDEVKR